MSTTKQPAFLAIMLSLGPLGTLAGPPFVTDDPEPVEYQHVELYLASLPTHDADGWSGTLPHLEVNYGAAPNLQLHLIAPVAFAAPKHGSTQFGYGDTEPGAKYRFLDENGKPSRRLEHSLSSRYPAATTNAAWVAGTYKHFCPCGFRKAGGRRIVSGLATVAAGTG